MRPDERVWYMATQGGSPVEKALRKVLVPVCVLSGVLVASGFFFPWFVGSVVTGRAWLVISLLFFGAGLSYLALLPSREETTDEDATRSAPYLLRIRHTGPLKMVRGFFRRKDPVTFGVPVAGLSLFLLARYAFPSETVAVVDSVSGLLLQDLSPVLLGSMLVAVLFCLFLLVGSWGDIKLGGEDAEPTYTYPVYFAMFFTAGIAAGIVFWGPAEALFHYQSPPPFFGAQAGSGAAVTDALTYVLFHWGVSAWSAYLAIGIPIAYFVYERGAPLRVSTLLAPFLGVENLDSYPARVVDVLAVFATIGGVGTSVGLVSQQFLTGTSYQWDVSFGVLGPVVFAAGLTTIYVIAAESGVHRGIRRVAGVTVALFGLFTLLLLAVGPRSFILEQGGAAVERYVTNFVPMSLFAGGEWFAAWTGYYWSWWFSWAPFAGLFLAALSKGRRIRTVVFTGVVATSAATVVWFLVMGGTSLFLQHSGTVDVLGAMGTYASPESVAGFPALSALPMGELLVFLFLALILVFIATSAATSTLVVSILGARRGLAPTTGGIVFWGVFQGAVAVSALLVGGAESLQTLAVLTGGPFAVISVLAVVGLLATLFRNEREGHRSLFQRVHGALESRGLAPPEKRPDLRDEGGD
jgi:glycine betaine transporter